QQKLLFPAGLTKSFTATFVTATMAGGFMAENIMSALNDVTNLHARLEIVKNNFYGASIRVTGLLTGQDIFNHLSKKELGDKVFLPANCLKDDYLFLDDWTIAQLSSKLNCPIAALNNEFVSIFDNPNYL
ncbi:MAG: DUF512 domain-containing protein, partial [bacterium]